MFEYFLKKNNKTFAYDTKNGLKEFNTTKNVEDILITSNNIEEIENILTDFKKEYEWKKLLIQSDKIDSVIATILTLIGAVIFSASNIVLTAGILLLIISNSITITSIRNEKKLNKAFNMHLNELVKEFTIENEKLNKLKKKDQVVDSQIVTHKIYIDRSKKIENLHRKLELINYFTENNTKLIKLYKSDILNFELQNKFSIDDIVFITFLIEQQINNKEQIKNQKVRSIKK